LRTPRFLPEKTDLKTNPLAKELEQRIAHRILLNKSQNGDSAAANEVTLIRQERALAFRQRQLRQQEKHLRKQARRKNQSDT
jgi:hypothetical protein